MKAAIVTESGQPPVYGDFREPAPAPGQSLIRVSASSLSHITRNRAAGSHYSSDGALPFIPGIDGTGVTHHGRHVYFLMPQHPFGAMAERCLADDAHCIAIPDGLDDASAAAMAIPGMSSWAALVERARLRAGETVLINGATGISGRLAIQIARHLGAGKIIATGRQTASFGELRRLGADVTVALVQDPHAQEQAFADQFHQRVDIVLDYLWGISAQTLMIAAARTSQEGVPVRFVQIGSLSGADITLPGGALRSSGLQLMGSGIGSVPFPRMLASIQGVLAAAPSAGFTVASRSVPLAEVARAWAAKDTGARIVLRP